MPTKIVRKPEDIDAPSNILGRLKLPLTVSWVQGAARSDSQNRLSHRWYADIARYFGDRTTEEVRAACKVEHGIPILSRDNPALAYSFDATFGPKDYKEIVSFVMLWQIPVTSLMKVKQMTEYLDTVQRTYTERGVHLTDPEAMKYEEEFR